jgi:NADPH-dependent 2,4-dienoyl-CoA reductase/sulfur reductase-like enzyme
MTHEQPGRRELLKLGVASAVATALAGCASAPKRSAGRVVVVGGGFGGATAAKYLRLWSEGAIDVTLVEPNPQFVSCPISNLVLGGSKSIADITLSYDGLRKYGARVVRDTVAAIDGERRQVRLASSGTLAYDRLIVSAGIELLFDRVRGMSEAAAEAIPHAWKAGPQTVLLRRQLEAMPDGGVVLISVPLAPYRCPPGPYERTCQIAHYLKTNKSRSKVIVLDANGAVTSKGSLFARVWKEDYPSIVEYRPNSTVAEVDVKARAFVLDLGERIRGDVLNLIPPMRAASIARAAGLVTANDRWCGVDWTTLESVAVKRAHVLGDSTLSAPGMPKSGHMANQHGKAAAAAIVDLFADRQPVPTTMTNACYSFVDPEQAVHVSSVHRWVADKRTLEPVGGAGGVSSANRATWAQEGAFAWGWAQTIWSDTLA